MPSLVAFTSGVEVAVDRVVGQEERHGVDRPEVVDGDELKVRSPGPGRPEEVAADTAESIDTHTDCQGKSCLLRRIVARCCETVDADMTTNPSIVSRSFSRRHGFPGGKGSQVRAGAGSQRCAQAHRVVDHPPRC